MAAEAIVSTVLEQLILIAVREAEKEVRLVVGVKEEIEKLTSNFRAIRAVLIDAEQRQVQTEEETPVGVWLDKLKDASYDMDDVLDEWNTAILKLQIEGVENAQNPKKNVRFLFSSPCFCFRQIALRQDIGVKIKRLNAKLDSIATEKDRYNLNTLSSIEKPQRSETTSFIDVSEIHGRDDDKKKLVNMLLSESNEALPAFSIVGMGGIGKTTLAQFACNNARIKSKFDKIIWVCVSNPFDELRIARAIIEGFTGETFNLVGFQSHLECIRKTIENKKFLLILDDVWEENDDQWKQLYNSLNNGLHGESRILVTTRKEKVTQMMKSSDVINIGELSSEESWSLFEQLVFCDRSQEECGNLENIGREIVGRCKGLPLAIKTIGSFLRFKKTREQWQRVLESEIWKLKESKELEKGIFHPLLLSYNDLPSMVKRCFSYCAVFPKDYKMKKDDLIQLWMAQGYLGLEGDEKLEIIGEECFNTLAMHSFFQEFKKDEHGNIYMCKMHDIVHDFAQFVVKNECFSKEIYGGEEASIGVFCEKARHSMLILKSSYHVNTSSVQKLRSLLIEGDYESGWMSNLSQLTCLRSLKISGNWNYEIPSEIGNYEIPSEIGKLIHLRYFNVSRLKIKELPEALCCLYNLQTLNISECQYLEKLPQGMGKLINLRHLLNSGTEELKYMPKGMERLVCLRRLDIFIVGGDPNGMGLGCLKNMNKLRGELRLEGLGEVVDEAEAKNAQLMNKKNLVELTLWFSGGSEISSVEECNKDSAVLEALQPPPNLEILWIMRCRSISLSPHWMVLLTHLKKLTLSYCRNCEYLPANFGKLPLLEDLSIWGMSSVKRVGNEFVGIETSSSSSSSPSLIAFPKLKTLQIESMKNWEEWDYKQTTREASIPQIAIPKALGTNVFDPEKPVIFTYDEILYSTDGFSDASLLGHGTYGSVYYGVLHNQEVAIKRMTATKSKEFMAEMKILCKVHHTNLVELIGYAATDDELFLIYEYAQKGSLRSHLHYPQNKGHTFLSWIMRVQIALDAARGLEYIHEHSKTHYVHRDIKTSNILLDGAFRAKISDFGLTKLVGKTSDGEATTTKVVGTFGYLAPEYLSDGLATTKSDVYAFGVLLFEIISGKDAIIRTEGMVTKNHERRSLASVMLTVLRNAPDSMSMSSMKDYIDPNMMDLYPHDCLFKLAMLAKQCVDEDPILRPDMKQVVISLSQILLSSVEWEATLAGNSQVFSGLVQGR